MRASVGNQMLSIRKILAVYDPTKGASLEEQPAVERALHLARKLGAELEIFACIYDQYLSGQRYVDSPGLEKARTAYVGNCLEQVRRLAAAVRSSHSTVSADAAWDTPLSDGIVRRVLKSHPDMVVKDTHRHARLQRVIFTNTDWHLLRDCPVPLLLVKQGQGSLAGPVIAAVDPLHDADKPAELDKQILDLAQIMGNCQASEVHLFHTYQTVLAAPTGISVGLEPIMLPMEMSEERIRQAHKREFDKLRQQAAVTDERAHLLQGDTRELLLELVTKLSASLVVMGVVARGTLERLFIGSTAERVLGDVACDVLVVKQKGFVTAVKER